ncbi:hypothetical protein K227x_08880 [Rubripirellula lacrimiformis]|uniref:RNA polymerase sigma factor n=1 Tax=Rubripirellula lacrimiformis TaxID=1930273 RepID=A0A517N5X6_9BACT|nr:hypothetical protein [Rubripirellula lacrimiformis]QDT02511.1 hypothetical protein K227x_08880 [Rubripirellula lacrimiformis]
MADVTSTDSGRISSINLVRSSHPWTQADSAAGFVLRYLSPMRRQLTAILGTSELADEALKLLLGHLVSVGFGEHKRGRLRDFLLRGIRSAAKSSVAELPEAARPKLKLDEVTLESKQWLSYWREGLLERAWRSLERQEHSDPQMPVYTILHGATKSSPSSPSMLAVQIASETGLKIDESQIQKILVESRTLFAQLIADEVAETLEDPSGEDVKREIAQLGLGKAFAGISV